MPTPDVALLISTYQRPFNLRRSLRSVAAQRGMEGRLEVVVTDDGSTDETAEIVQEFGRVVDFPVQFTTHAHSGFQLARCRNEGVAASSAPYLIFLDGDCVIPPDHALQHWSHQEPGLARAGHCCWLSKDLSERITEQVVATGDYLDWVPAGERWREWKAWLKARLYSGLKHPTKPKLIGANIGIRREDCERVNGFDECFHGWGCEDDDFRARLTRVGVRVRTTLPWTRTFHLWHPPAKSRPESWRDGANVSRFERGFRLTRCLEGLVKRELDSVDVRMVGRPSRAEEAQRMIRSLQLSESNGGQAEVEILFLPGEGQFSGRADCNILVLLDGAGESGAASRAAHLIVADRRPRGRDGRPRFKLEEFSKAVRAVG